MGQMGVRRRPHASLHRLKRFMRDKLRIVPMHALEDKM
jgi:hypothetical protein